MSDRVVQSDHGSLGTSRQPGHPYQSVWMAHWKHKHSSSKSATETHGLLPPGCEFKHDDGDAKPQSSLSRPEMTPAISKFANEVREVSGTKTVSAKNDSLKRSALKFREERFDSQSFPVFEERLDRRSFPMFNLSQKKESNLTLKNNPATLSHGEVMRPHTGPVSNPTLSRSHFLSLLEQARCKTESPSKECAFQSMGISCKPEQEVKSHNFLEKNSLAPFRSCQDDVGSSSKIMPYEHNNDCYSIPRLPLSVEDIETMRICTTVDSVENLFGGPPKFHTATRHFLFTKKTGFNLSEGGQVFGESSVSTKFKGKMFSEFLSVSPSFGFQKHYGRKLQSLGGSSGSEGKEHVRDVNTSAICLKNEASAETDTMEMGDIRRNHLSGADLTSVDKNVVGAQNSAKHQAGVGSATEENEDGFPTTDLPDINQELPALPAVPSSLDDRETSSSRTQSLDMDHLLSNAEKPTNFEPMEPDPSSRWLKRLKLSSSDSFMAYGTKNSKMGEASSHEKVDKFLSQIMKYSPSRSQPAAGGHLGNEQVAPDQTALLLKDGHSSSSDLGTKGQDITLSHPWIRRWCRSVAASPQKKPETVVICERQSSKSTFSDFQKKQFPSIGAMALMGKAMSGFHSCEFKKSGCFVVWNTKET